MHQQFGRSRQYRALTLGDGLTEFHRVPVDEDSRQQVDAGHAVMLSFTCPVAQFALTMEVNGTLQGMTCLAFVQPDLGTPKQVGISDGPEGLPSGQHNVGRTITETGRNKRKSSSTYPEKRQRGRGNVEMVRTETPAQIESRRPTVTPHAAGRASPRLYHESG